MTQVEDIVATPASTPDTLSNPEPALPQVAAKLGWRTALIVGSIAVLYAAVLAKLAFDWYNDPNFSHGFIVPLFSLFLVWQKRKKLMELPLKPSWFGLVVIVGSLALLVVGLLGAELFLSRTSLVFLIAGIVIYLLSWRHFQAIFFPWLFLFFMIPIPTIIFNQITFPLQIFASELASAILPIFGVPVLREGNVIQLPTMPLQVAEACSGIRSLMSLGTLAIVYGYFLDSSVWARIILFVASVPIAVAANAFRIVGTGLAVQYWDPQKALGFFHEFSGWVIFCASALMLFAVHGVTKSIMSRTRKSA